MFDKIVFLGNSWIGTLISYAVLVFLYYFVWLNISMFLLNKTTKHAFLYGKKSDAKLLARTLITTFLILGLNLVMYTTGLYSAPNADSAFLALLSVLFAVMIVAMIDIMSSNFSGAEDFYNTFIAFILTIGFLSPTKGLLTLDLYGKLYLLGGLLITFFLFRFKFVKTWSGNLTGKLTKHMLKNIQIK